jgi:hypothetical protein
MAGSGDGVGTAARLAGPTGLVVDAAGRLFIADTDNHTIRLAVTTAVPTIVTQPQSQTVSAGANVQFSVVCTGAPMPTYQWYFNGAVISGATGNALSLNSVQSTRAGDYTVMVSNLLGSVTSNKATLTVSTASTSPSPAGGGGGGGGGATETWFVALLVAAAAARWGRARRLIAYCRPSPSVGSCRAGSPDPAFVSDMAGSGDPALQCRAVCGDLIIRRE